MSSTTLVTFLVQTPKGVNTVQLLGSWDNFSRPYPMKRDTSLGSSYWRGCHSFTDIICDGESVEPAEGARDGALKMGGRYWYYYQIDGDLEYHNPKEPTTTSCPFLPGQEVNVMEVPTLTKAEVAGRRQGSTSSIYFTLNPQDKFRTPQPQPTRAPPARPPSRHLEVSTDIKAQQAEPHAQTFLALSEPSSSHSSISPQSTSYFQGQLCYTEPATRAASIRSTSSRLSRWRSALSRPLSRLPSRKGARAAELPPPVPPLPIFQPSNSRETADGKPSALGRPEITDILQTRRSWPLRSSLKVNTVMGGREFTVDGMTRHCHTTPACSQADQAIVDTDSASVKTTVGERPKFESSGEDQAELSESFKRLHTSNIVDSNASACYHENLPESNEEELDENDKLNSWYAPNSERDSCELRHRASVASSRTSGVFSSVVDTATVYTGSRSPWHLSQPFTPTIEGDCGSFLLDTTPVSPVRSEDGNSNTGIQGGFHGYTLPEDEYASALTLRNLETATSPSLQGEGSPFEPRHRDQIIAAWNEGTEQHKKTGLQELVDDLGYLGELIA